MNVNNFSSFYHHQAIEYVLGRFFVTAADMCRSVCPIQAVRFPLFNPCIFTYISPAEICPQRGALKLSNTRGISPPVGPVHMPFWEV